jgi:hypothetical protein
LILSIKPRAHAKIGSTFTRVRQAAAVINATDPVDPPTAAELHDQKDPEVPPVTADQ